MSIFTVTRPLPDGTPVAIRLARRSDAGAIGRLLAACGVAADPIDTGRLLRFDPTRRAVLCAATPTDGLIGLGAIDLAPDAEPDTLVCLTPGDAGAGPLLHAALRDRALRRRAA